MTYDSRNATVIISSEGLTETISVSQDTNYGLMSEPTSFNLTNEAQNIDFEVKANVEYTIAIDDACKDWISQVGTKALSSTKLTFSIAANESYDDREGKITISQKGPSTSVQPQVITVKQSQTNGLFITTPEYALSNESHDLTVEVKANIEYEVTSEVDWIKYEASSTKALTPTNISLYVEENPTYDERIGTVTVKQKGGDLAGIVTIKQAEKYGLFVSPESVEINKDAQEVEVEVQFNVDFNVIIPEDAKGSVITTVRYDGEGGTKALETRKYRFGVAENNLYQKRETSITFKQKEGPLCGTFKIKQAQRDTLGISPQKDSLSYEGGEAKLKVTTNVEYGIDIPKDVDWVTVSGPQTIEEADGLTVYEYTFKVSTKNISLTPKNATAFVSSKDGCFKSEFIIVQGPIPVPDNALPGLFSVSETKKVFFSKGNLQATYTGNAYSWAFADNQYDVVGNAAGNTTIDCQSKGAKVDLFGWSTDAPNNNWGIHTKTEPIPGWTNGNFKDWGLTINGSDIWRTLTDKEYLYLFGSRKDATKLYGHATVNGIKGIIILPDDFTDPNVQGDGGNAAFNPESLETGWMANIYKSGNWVLMERNGAVFWPAAGLRGGSSVGYVGDDSGYWSSTALNAGDAGEWFFYNSSSYSARDSKYDGRSVRLVSDCE